MKSAVKSLQGNKYNQLFVNDKGWEYSYPMKLKSDSPDALKTAFEKFGLPEIMVTDNAPELVKGEWGKMLKVHYVDAKTTEPHSPWQNRAESGIREHKKATRRHVVRNLSGIIARSTRVTCDRASLWLVIQGDDQARR
jgi:hypothetical protein